jgi:hypothetical protein
VVICTFLASRVDLDAGEAAEDRAGAEVEPGRADGWSDHPEDGDGGEGQHQDPLECVVLSLPLCKVPA